MKKRNFWKIVGYSVIVCLLAPMTAWIGTADAADSFGDPFESNKLKNPNWKWQNEPPTWDVGKTREGFLYIDCEPNPSWWALESSNFLYQETESDTFDVQTRFFTKWKATSGLNGILVSSPADDNWISIRYWARPGAGQIQFRSKRTGLVPDPAWRSKSTETELYLRLKKNRNQISALYKTKKPDKWIQVGISDMELTPPLQLGIFAGLDTSDGKLEVVYDYFGDNTDLFPVEPDGKATTTWGEVKTRY